MTLQAGPKINLRGGGDIASNPERERARALTKEPVLVARLLAEYKDCGAGSLNAARASAMAVDALASGRLPPFNRMPMVGDTVELDDPDDGLLTEDWPENRGWAGFTPFDKTLDHAFGSAEWSKLTQAEGGLRCECGSSDMAQHNGADVNTASPYRECWACYQKRKQAESIPHPPKDGAHE